MKNGEMITSGQIKRQILHLTQLENMIELGYSEYQRYYEEVFETVKNANYSQLMIAKNMLELTLGSRQGLMSEIESDMYVRAIEVIDEIKKERFTAHNEFCTYVEMG